MEGESVVVIPFSKVLATMLLMKENDGWYVSCGELINFSSLISSSNRDIEVCIDDDDESYLDCCVEHDDNYNFTIKVGYNYDTLLDNGFRVRDYLKINSLSDEFLGMLLKDLNKNDTNDIDNISLIDIKKKKHKTLFRKKWNKPVGA